MQTYTDGRLLGHLRSRDVSHIAAEPCRSNIGFRKLRALAAKIRKTTPCKGAPDNSCQAQRLRRYGSSTECVLSGIPSKYL